VENDEADIFLFRRALQRVRFKGTLRVLGSVTEARAYLRGVPPFDDRAYYPVPDLIISDMNLASGETGNDFLAWLRATEPLCAIPFLFLSGSFVPADRELSHALGTSGFFAKTGDMEEMVQRVRRMLKFLPPERAKSAIVEKVSR
jgi:DNA-binding NarL/FixJ family response regulator